MGRAPSTIQRKALCVRGGKRGNIGAMRGHDGGCDHAMRGRGSHDKVVMQLVVEACGCYRHIGNRMHTNNGNEIEHVELEVEGLNVTMNNNATPLDYVDLYMHDRVMELIVTETNRYAAYVLVDRLFVPYSCIRFSYET